MDDLIQADLYRFNGKRGFISLINTAIRKWEFRHLLLLRWYQKSKVRFVPWMLLRRSCIKTGIQIGWSTKIDKGFVIVHFGNIAINNNVIIGKNCTVTHGVTIGITNRGDKRGCPIIGDSVWIGSNAVIVGKIIIGNDVLIAPLSYVNEDVPSHSIVIGNPARIIPRENATEDYINRII